MADPLQRWRQTEFDFWTRHRRALLVTILAGLLVLALIPTWMVLVYVPGVEKKDAAEREQCFAQNRDEILGYIAKAPDAATAASLTKRFDHLASEAHPSSGYCANVNLLKTQARSWADGTFSTTPPGEDASQSPSPSVSASPTP